MPPRRTGRFQATRFFQFRTGAYQDSNGYVISEQGKPPDLIMEIAAHSTGREDTRNKRAWYAGFGVPEYWWFDQIGDLHGSKYAGEPLGGVVKTMIGW